MTYEDMPLNIMLVNQHDGNELVSDVEHGNYIILHTGLEDEEVDELIITVTKRKNGHDVTYTAVFDERRELMKEWTREE